MYEIHGRNANGKFASLGKFKTAQAAREKYLELHPVEKLLANVESKEQPPPDDDQEAEAAVCSDTARPSEFTVSLDAELLKLPLGLNAVSTADRKALVVMNVRHGAISSWNARNPERQVRIGDRIVKVAEVSEKAEQLMSALNQRDPFDVVIRVPEEFRVCLSKGSAGKLGIEVAKRNAFLQVKKVGNEGVMKKWNDANPAMAVQPYHIIIEVNGVRGDADLMVTEVEFEQTVELLLR
jgi:hypothetical protein